MNKNLVFIALISFIFACQRPQHFDRSNELFSYLSKVQGLNLQSSSKAQVFIFQVGFCGTCTGEVMMLIEQNKNLCKDSTYFVLSKTDTKLEQRLAKIPNSLILIDKSPFLPKYGLFYSKDMLFVLTNGEVKKWFKLDTDGTEAANLYLNNQ